MIFVQGHKSGMDAAALAVASQHIAQQSCDAVAAASSVRATTRGAGAVALIRRDALTCCDVVACALMSAHKAAQCIAEAACAIASQHLAQQSLREVSPQFEFRYQ